MLKNLWTRPLQERGILLPSTRRIWLKDQSFLSFHYKCGGFVLGSRAKMYTLMAGQSWAWQIHVVSREERHAGKNWPDVLDRRWTEGGVLYHDGQF